MSDRFRYFTKTQSVILEPDLYCSNPKEISSFGLPDKKVLAILKFYFRMERAETKVSVHSSHHTPLDNLSGGFLFKGDILSSLAHFWLKAGF